MSVFDDVFTPESASFALDILVKLGIAVILGGAIGWEREMHGRPAGVRTHMLVVLGVTLFAEVSRHFSGGDPGRIAAQIVTGIGFLGAGTILRFGAEIRGLTTAASIWAVAAIGMAVSTGGVFLIVAVAATVLALFTLAVVDNIEKRFAPQSHPKVWQIELESAEGLDAATSAINEAGGRIIGIRVVSTHPQFVVQMDLSGSEQRLLKGLGKCPAVKSAAWME